MIAEKAFGTQETATTNAREEDARIWKEFQAEMGADLERATSNLLPPAAAPLEVPASGLRLFVLPRQEHYEVSARFRCDSNETNLRLTFNWGNAEGKSVLASTHRILPCSENSAVQREVERYFRPGALA